MAQAEKSQYRGVEYQICRIGGGRWSLAVCSEWGESPRYATCIEGDREQAVIACKVEIDRLLALSGRPPEGTNLH